MTKRKGGMFPPFLFLIVGTDQLTWEWLRWLPENQVGSEKG